MALSGDTSGGGGSLEMLSKALEAVKNLRSNVGGFFETIGTGSKLVGTGGSPEEEERNFKAEFQHFMQKMVENVK
jgi:hypothetical protein